ncbi:hypothetical protein [Streptosporangium canum]|uniref:hypothetical protein n=1 Tax=Streptosporangium canum TaxID=324952 RepID=UPI0033BB6E96
MSAQLTGDLNGLLCAPHESSAVIRSLLRRAAADVSQHCDPTDLAAAHDACTLHLQAKRPLPEHQDVLMSGSITLAFSTDNETAVRQLINRQRAQGIDAAVETQRAEHLRRILSDPATAVPWWLGSQTKPLTAPSVDQLKNAVTSLAEVSKAFRQLAPPIDSATESNLLELLRIFVSSFPQEHQKRMLMTLMALGFDKAGRPHLATSVEQLMEVQYPAPTNTTSHPSPLAEDNHDLKRDVYKSRQSNGRL